MNYCTILYLYIVWLENIQIISVQRISRRCFFVTWGQEILSLAKPEKNTRLPTFGGFETVWMMGLSLRGSHIFCVPCYSLASELEQTWHTPNMLLPIEISYLSRNFYAETCQLSDLVNNSFWSLGTCGWIWSHHQRISRHRPFCTACSGDTSPHAISLQHLVDWWMVRRLENDGWSSIYGVCIYIYTYV